MTQKEYGLSNKAGGLRLRAFFRPARATGIDITPATLAEKDAERATKAAISSRTQHASVFMTNDGLHRPERLLACNAFGRATAMSRPRLRPYPALAAAACQQAA